MSNECRRVIKLHAVTEIHKRLLEENISISRQALMYTRRGVVTVLPESQYPVDIGKFIYN